MSFAEILTVVWDATLFLGNVLFHSLIGLSVILMEMCKFLIGFCLSSIEYVIASLWVLGLCLFHSLPYFFHYLHNAAYLFHDGFITTTNYLLDFTISMWSSNLFVQLREMTVWGVAAGVGAIWGAVTQSPLLFARWAAVGFCTVLVVGYWRDLVGVVRHGWEACVRKVVAGRKRVAEGGRRVKHGVMQPFRVVARIPAQTSAAAGALGQKIKASSSSVSFPSLRALYTSEPPSPELDIAQLHSDIHKLKERLEEERDAKTCVICHDNLRNIVCMPCRHFALCEECSSMLPKNILSNQVCPVCRKQIREMIKIYV